MQVISSCLATNFTILGYSSAKPSVLFKNESPVLTYIFKGKLNINGCSKINLRIWNQEIGERCGNLENVHIWIPLGKPQYNCEDLINLDHR